MQQRSILSNHWLNDHTS